MKLTPFLVIVLVAWSYTARAEPAGAQAEVLFRQGRELLAAGKIPEACAAFGESQKLEPAVTTLLNFAGCREKLGQIATAWGLFLEAERQTRSADDAATQQLHAVAQEHAAKLEPRVSKLTIHVAPRSQIDGLEIARGADRVDPAMWNRALPSDGGTYTITAHAPGTRVWTTQIAVAAEGDSQTVEIPDLRATAVAVALPVAPPHASAKVAPIAVGVGAVALFGGALGFELWGSSTYNDAKAEMTDQARRDSLQSSANDKRYVAEGLAVGGVAAAGVAVWLYLHGNDETPPTTARRLVVSPTSFAIAGAF